MSLFYLFLKLLKDTVSFPFLSSASAVFPTPLSSFHKTRGLYDHTHYDSYACLHYLTSAFPLFFSLQLLGCVGSQLWHTGSLCCHVGSFTPAVQGFSGCGSQALRFPVAGGIPVPWPGTKLASAALQSRHLTTGPPEKFLPLFLKK